MSRLLWLCIRYLYNTILYNSKSQGANDNTSVIELIVKGTLYIGKNASIRIRNGYFPNAPDEKISSLTNESLHKIAVIKNNAILHFPGIFGKGGNDDGIGEGGGCGESRTSGGSGGGGNSGNGGENGEKSTRSKLNLLNSDSYHNGAGGGGGGYGGGLLVIAAVAIEVQISDFPCFVVAGQKGGKGGYPNGQDGENGEGGMLVIETNNYKPLLSHWNIGNSILECNNSTINGGHDIITGNPQKVFINGIDVSNYTDNSIKAFDSNKRSAALIKKISG